MGSAAGYEVRAPGTAEADAVAEVLIAGDLHDTGEATLGADFLRSKWERLGFDLGTDAWVIVDGAGMIVGYGHAQLQEHGVVNSLGTVHPAHRGQGIGSLLLDRIERRASELLAGSASSRFRHAINAADQVAAAMLEARGLRPVRHFWHMQLDIVGPVDPGPVLEDIEIRTPASDDDLRAVHRILSAAFTDHWGHSEAPFDLWVQEQTGDPSHDRTLWLLAIANGQPIGTLTASARGGRGWIDELGVLVPWRGRGIGAVLLRRAFATFADRGIERVLLNVDADNTTAATALYQSVGMRVVNRWDMWERHSEEM